MTLLNDPDNSGRVTTAETAPSWLSRRVDSLKAVSFDVKLTFWLVVGLAAAFLVLFVRSDAVLFGFRFMFDNLPLTLPILTVVLAALLRPHELVTIQGWLRLTTSFALGLVSFAIWAFVAGQTVKQYVVINSEKVFNKDHALLLVIMSFVWASFCSIITALAEKGPDKAKRWQVVQCIQFCISAPLLFLPFFLFEAKAVVEKTTGQSFDARQYTVSIPYRDALLNQHLGRTSDPITQCYVARKVTGRTAREAIGLAVKNMLSEDLAFKPKGNFKSAARSRNPGESNRRSGRSSIGIFSKRFGFS